MKKRLLLIPLISAFALSGCDFMDTVKGWFSPKSEDKTPSGKKESGDDSDIPELVVDHTPQIKETYGGYKLARTLQEGKRYILGAYRHKSDTMRFFNGDYHRDSAGYYPYYLGTVEDSTDGAAQVEIEFVGSSTTEYNIKVVEIPGDGEKPYLNKYLGIYTGLTDRDNLVTSLAALANASDTTYTDPVKGTEHDDVKTTFTFTEKYNQTTETGTKEVDVYAPCMSFARKTMTGSQGSVEGDAVERLVFIGTVINSNNYTSFDTQFVETATDGGAYDLVHFYEAIE